ncbi:MAG TPA: hypothetical protein VN026_00940 [Bacteroidia bacterium]|jgi:hypothetical protein|nr:hypothetical protein [Bacteroidia bacterium]
MSNDHNNNGHNEKKSVAFTAPLILGSITIFIILCFVSLGNPCNGRCENGKECSKECMEACEKGDHSKHPEDMKEANSNETKTEAVETDNSHAAELPADSTKSVTKPVKEEEHH